MTVTLLITTYNWPAALELVLLSVERQTIYPDLVLIGDDGSNSKTAALIESFSSTCSFNIKHLWQEDDGFRRTSILNKCIIDCNTDYIIQVDGDCILHNKFIEDHKIRARKRQALYGSRVNIIESARESVLSRKQLVFKNNKSIIKNHSRNKHLPFLSIFYPAHRQLSKKIRGCNLSYWRDDALAINGYNEDMTGWGREDSEFVIRLLNHGIKIKRLRYMGIIYHIWHKTTSKSSININNTIQQQAIDNKLTIIKNGASKYLNSSIHV